MSPQFEGHFQKSLVRTETFYPLHKRRQVSEAYRKVREQLVVALDTPCAVCGVRNSDLRGRRSRRDPGPAAKAPRATKIELHHHVIEWALAKAIDLEKFNAQVVRKLYGARRRKFTQEEMEAWIDHSPDNLQVLCNVHHRHSWVGIHSISGPIWGALGLLKEGWPVVPPNAKPQWFAAH